jgi:cytochrome P450
LLTFEKQRGQLNISGELGLVHTSDSFQTNSQGDFNTQIMKDLFGNGIFATDGEKWRHQRKLASHEFSTRVLRDFSSGVFRINAAKLTEKISSAAANRTSIDMQVLL